MKPSTNSPRASRLRSRSAAFGLLGLAAALMLTTVFFRPAVSHQGAPDPAADALPQLNRLGKHAAEAAEYARQIKSRYGPNAPEYVEGKRRYEAAAERFDALTESLADSLKGNSARRSMKEQVRLAVEAADSFNDWTEAGLRLLRRGRVGGGAPPKADEMESAAVALAKDFGARDQRAKSRAVELLGQMVKFTPWDEIPPVKAHASSVLPTPEPSPKPVVP